MAGSAAWSGDFETEVRKFTVVGGGIYSPDFHEARAGERERVYEVPSELRHNFNVSKLKPATIKYRDDAGKTHEGKLTTAYTHYAFTGSITFRPNPGSVHYRFAAAEGQGAAQATWSMKFDDGSQANGTFVASDITLGKAGEQAVLRIPFGVQVSSASGPLAGEAGQLTGSCPKPEDCKATSVVRFIPTERSLKPPADLSRAFAAAVTNKPGKLRLKLKPGPGKTHFALPTNDFLSNFAKHRIVATTTPGARCKPTYKRRAPGARSATREDIERLYRDGLIDLGTYESILHGEPAGRTAAVESMRITIACRKDGVKLPSVTRTVRVRR